MPTYSVKVEFIVEAEQVGPWSPEQAARDYVKHRIDQGYRMEGCITDWAFLSVEPRPPRAP